MPYPYELTDAGAGSNDKPKPPALNVDDVPPPVCVPAVAACAPVPFVPDHPPPFPPAPLSSDVPPPAATINLE